MRRFFLLCLCLTFFVLPSYAQAEKRPIIAISEGAIYALDAETGEAEMLVPAPKAYEAMLEYSYRPITVSDARWLSPDGQYLAYAMLYPSNPDEEIDENTVFVQHLFLLDSEAPNRPISLGFGAETAYFESVAWSLDSGLLYVLVNNSVKIIERETWAEQASIDVGEGNRSQNPVISRYIFAIENGFVVVDGGNFELAIEFTVFDNEGNQLHFFKVDWNLSPDVNLFINTPFTPLMLDGHVEYGFVDMNANYLLYQTNFENGEITEAEFGHPAMLSRSAIDSSIHLYPFFYTGDSTGLLIFDSEDNYIGEIGTLSIYAYPMSSESIGSTFALSPDGQQLAYLQDNQVMLWENGESRSLDFSADIIVWASPIYMPFSPDYFRG